MSLVTFRVVRQKLYSKIPERRNDKYERCELVEPRIHTNVLLRVYSCLFVVKMSAEEYIVANGQKISAALPCSLEDFLIAQKLLPRSVVVEHNGQAVAPSEFARRQLCAGDKLEIVKIVAGG
jgi:thiamine biosynthesis protein ThiS